MDEVNNSTNDDIKVNGKAEEHPSGVESDSYSESIENECEELSADEEVAASGVGNKRDISKVTNKDVKLEPRETNDDNIPQSTDDLFHDSDGDESSTSDIIVMDKGDIKTGSGNKRKAENGDDNTEVGKKQRCHDKE